jgi:hypothetical protein
LKFVALQKKHGIHREGAVTFVNSSTIEVIAVDAIHIHGAIAAVYSSILDRIQPVKGKSTLTGINAFFFHRIEYIKCGSRKSFKDFIVLGREPRIAPHAGVTFYDVPVLDVADHISIEARLIGIDIRLRFCSDAYKDE